MTIQLMNETFNPQYINTDGEDTYLEPLQLDMFKDYTMAVVLPRDGDDKHWFSDSCGAEIPRWIRNRLSECCRGAAGRCVLPNQIRWLLQRAMGNSERMGQIQKRLLSHIVAARKSENSQ